MNLSLSDHEPTDDFEENPEEIAELSEQLTATEARAAPEAEQPALAPEPIFARLLRRAIDPGDAVLTDYATYVAPRLSARLAHVAAKGGDFALRKRAAGAPAEEVARYGDDQSMRAHIVNGLLPVARVARTLKHWGVQRFVDEFNDETYRLFCAGYTLHDWLKLPGVNEKLHALGLTHHTVSVAIHLRAGRFHITESREESLLAEKPARHPMRLCMLPGYVRSENRINRWRRHASRSSDQIHKKPHTIRVLLIRRYIKNDMPWEPQQPQRSISSPTTFPTTGGGRRCTGCSADTAHGPSTPSSNAGSHGANSWSCGPNWHGTCWRSATACGSTRSAAHAASRY